MLRRSLTEAREQQTATSEILSAISSAQTDARPVFDAIARSAVRLCEAHRCSVLRVEGDVLHYVARCEITSGRQVVQIPLIEPLGADSLPARTIRERRIIQVSDVPNDPLAPPKFREMARAGGYRALMVVPMLRDDAAVGAIALMRPDPIAFTERHVDLVKTFANQAVIAIENVRLFTELQEKNRALTQAHAQTSEALQQQTATSDILRVISSSPTDVKPVFDAIARNARELLAGHSGSVTRVIADAVHLMAFSTVNTEGDALFREGYPVRLDQWPLAQRTVRERTAAIVDDVETHPDVTERGRRVARARGFRSFVWMPMIHGGETAGWISVGRADPGPFGDNELALLKTFADQAVIAIENVRLFTELESRNRDLTATSEILQVISRSPTDVQPVFETIVDNAHRLFRSVGTVVLRYDGDFLSPAALRVSAETREWVPRLFPMRPSPDSAAGRCVLTRAAVHVADYEAPDAPAGVRDVAKAGGWRSALAVPMFRDEQIIGAIFVSRATPGAFADREIALLKTFADQAVIAIENVRLFKELEARTQDLTRSVGELRALGEVGQAISSTLNLQTVLSTIVTRATQLSGTDAGVIYEYDEGRELFEPRATERLEEEIVRALVATPIRKGEGATGQLASSREPIEVADVRDRPQAFQAREVLVRAGYRAALAVPLVREDRLLGGLTVFRKTPGDFTPEVLDLLKTFATQSALAIQNARLFREIEEKSRQLEAASQHKSEFLANMSHELRTPLNAIIGFSEVLSEKMFGELNEKQEEYSKDIHASGQHLLSLINDILDLSKIEAGRMELELTDFHLPTALDNALTLIRERAGRRSIALHTNIDSRLGQIQADERKIRQVVLNLLSNAIKFTPEGGRIEVAAVSKDGLAEVSVSDTGVGIALEDQEKVFEEFRQVGTADKKAEGTGLGLTLCRKFVELHGGRIWVESQVGAGSTFTFAIPVRRAK